MIECTIGATNENEFQRHERNEKNEKDMEDYNGFEYVGDVPTVYKGAAYEEFYEPLYMRQGENRIFYAIKTEKGLEAIADGKNGTLVLDDNHHSKFQYNAENDRLCAMIPKYEM